MSKLKLDFQALCHVCAPQKPPGAGKRYKSLLLVPDDHPGPFMYVYACKCATFQAR
jgi:hypothetical protein